MQTAAILFTAIYAWPGRGSRKMRGVGELTPNRVFDRRDSLATQGYLTLPPLA